MENNAEALINYTMQQLASLIFLIDHRLSPRFFTRESPLGFVKTVLLTLRSIKKSIKAEILDFFHKIDKNIISPSRQALTQAREKISFLAFKNFFDKSCELAVNSDGARLFKGFRIFAVDGTSFVVGALGKLAEYFGTSTTIEGKAMCRISAVVDVLNECIVNGIVSPFCVGERALAIEQIKQLMSVTNALFLFDRGYWSPELVSAIIENGQKFVMRLPSNVGKTIVKDKDGNIVKLRRYSFILPSGERETLLTNLTKDEMSDEELADLYAMRWGAETKYLELKDRLQIDQFSGESVNIVLQDIYSTLYMSNLVAFICFESDEIIKERTTGKNNKYEKKSNRSTCISALRTRFVEICFMANEQKREEALRRLYIEISKDTVDIGKSKSRPRDKRKLKESRLHRPKKSAL